MANCESEPEVGVAKRGNREAVNRGASVVSPTAAVSTSAEHGRNLVRSMLDVVPIDDVIEVLKDRVVASNRHEHLMAALVLSGERTKPRIEQASGPSWSSAEAAKAIGTSAETVRKRVHENKLVGYPAIGDRTRLRIPRWQFDGDENVHAWTSRLLAAFGENGWALLDFVTVPRTHLSLQSYLHLLLQGRVDEVLRAAKRSNAD